MSLTGRRNLNFIEGAGIGIALADDPLLDAIDITVDAPAPLVACWAGPVPNLSGVGIVLRVPKIGSDSVTFNLKTLFSRLEALPSSGGVQFTVEKSVGGAAFSAVSVGSNTHGTTDQELEDTGLTGTIASGDLVRLNFVNVSGGNGGTYCVELTALQQ